MFILTPAQINKSLLNQSKRILVLALCQRLEFTIKILLRVIKLFFLKKKKQAKRNTFSFSFRNLHSSIWWSLAAERLHIEIIWGQPQATFLHRRALQCSVQSFIEDCCNRQLHAFRLLLRFFHNTYIEKFCLFHHSVCSVYENGAYHLVIGSKCCMPQKTSFIFSL